MASVFSMKLEATSLEHRMEEKVTMFKKSCVTIVYESKSVNRPGKYNPEWY